MTTRRKPPSNGKARRRSDGPAPRRGSGAARRSGAAGAVATGGIAGCRSRRGAGGFLLRCGGSLLTGDHGVSGSGVVPGSSRSFARAASKSVGAVECTPETAQTFSRLPVFASAVLVSKMDRIGDTRVSRRTQRIIRALERDVRRIDGMRDTLRLRLEILKHWGLIAVGKVLTQVRVRQWIWSPEGVTPLFAPARLDLLRRSAGQPTFCLRVPAYWPFRCGGIGRLVP